MPAAPFLRLRYGAAWPERWSAVRCAGTCSWRARRASGAAPCSGSTPTLTFLPVVDGAVDVDGGGGCSAPSGTGVQRSAARGARCFSCRLTRRQPEVTHDRPEARRTAVAKRRLLIQLMDLDLPIVPYYERDGGRGSISSPARAASEVIIGHFNGIIDRPRETLDLHRERLRVSLGEPYRTCSATSPRDRTLPVAAGLGRTVGIGLPRPVRGRAGELRGHRPLPPRRPRRLAGELHLLLRHHASVGGLCRMFRHYLHITGVGDRRGVR